MHERLSNQFLDEFEMPYYLSINEPLLNFEEDDYWKKEWGLRSEIKGPMSRGEIINPIYLPKTGFIKNEIEHIPPFLCRPYWICNDDVKSIIENLEPGRHQFLPLEIRKGKYGASIELVYIINIVSNVEAIDTARSDKRVVKIMPYPRKHDGGECAYIDPMEVRRNRDGISLNEKEIDGAHIWLDKKLGRYSEAFISDLMYEALKLYIKNQNFFVYETN